LPESPESLVVGLAVHGRAGLALDLDAALALLPPAVRLCVVLSYQEGMSHGEIAAHAGLPVGTVKSHVRRGARRLQTLLSAYRTDEERHHE
jgi:RNA polymerase sigma-70 factor (ECF subfamily)